MNRIALTMAFVLVLSATLWSQNTNKKSKNPKKPTTAMFLENESKYGFDETVEKLTAQVTANTWKLTAIHDLQQTLKNNGQDVLPVKVFAVCHPKHSGELLAMDDERVVSPLMPCRISVYTKSNGKTYISRLNVAAFAPNMEPLVAKVMTESGDDIELIVSSLIVLK
jgi:uncharacterized protein (DUF302 family)